MAYGLALPAGEDESGGAGRVSGGHGWPGLFDFCVPGLYGL